MSRWAAKRIGLANRSIHHYRYCFPGEPVRAPPGWPEGGAMSRENFHHNANTLAALADALQAAAEKVRDVARLARRELGKETVSLAHQRGIDKGLEAIEKLCREARTKLEKPPHWSESGA